MTAPYPVAAAPEPPKKRSFRWLWWLIGIVVVLGVLLVIADVATRAYAESRASAEIASSLPENVQGDIDVSIGGASFLAQIVTGRIGEVTLDAPELTVSGVPVAAHVVADGVPTDLSQPIDQVHATLTLDQAGVDKVISIPGGSGLALGDGQVSYDGEISVFGFTVGYQVTGEVTASGTDILIQPGAATLDQGAGSLNLDLDQVLGGITKDPIAICVANYLPQGAQLQALTVTPGQATVELTARGFVANEQSFTTMGTCG